MASLLGVLSRDLPVRVMPALALDAATVYVQLW
jgi:hypothetical protein